MLRKILRIRWHGAAGGSVLGIVLLDRGAAALDFLWSATVQADCDESLL